MPGRVQHERHGGRGGKFEQRLGARELVEGRKLQPVAGDDPDRTEQDQAAGRAQKSADDGIGDVADGATHPRNAESAQHDAGSDRRDAERDQHRRQ